MAIKVFITSEIPQGLTQKRLILLMRFQKEIRQSEAVVLLSEDVNAVNLQTAWNTGVPIPEPLRAWTSYEGMDDTLFLQVSRDMLEQLKEGGTLVEGGTLAKITQAGRAVLSDNPVHIAAGNRLALLFKAATPAQQADFIVLIALIVMSKIGQR